MTSAARAMRAQRSCADFVTLMTRFQFAACSAALSCFMPPRVAEAQSSLTLYGLYDEFVGYQSGTVKGVPTSLVLLGNNGQAVSRLGLRGTEALGDGYHVDFALENG